MNASSSDIADKNNALYVMHIGLKEVSPAHHIIAAFVIPASENQETVELTGHPLVSIDIVGKLDEERLAKISATLSHLVELCSFGVVDRSKAGKS